MECVITSATPSQGGLDTSYLLSLHCSMQIAKEIVSTIEMKISYRFQIFSTKQVRGWGGDVIYSSCVDVIKSWESRNRASTVCTSRSWEERSHASILCKNGCVVELNRMMLLGKNLRCFIL